MTKRMTEAEAMKAAEDLMKTFAKIRRESIKREIGTVECFDVETGKKVM